MLEKYGPPTAKETDMSLLGLLLFEFVIISLGTVMVLWAAIDIRRGFNFREKGHLVKGRYTNVARRDEAPAQFLWVVLMKVATGLMMYGNAIYGAILWLPSSLPGLHL